MAMEFAVKFEHEVSQRWIINEADYGTPWARAYYRIGFNNEITGKDKIYILEESLHIFEPKVGDIAWWQMHDGGMCFAETTPLLINQDGFAKIIQRKKL